MRRLTAIPAALQEFIPESERAPAAFTETWRYTPVAGLTLVPAVPQPRQHHVIKEMQTIRLSLQGAVTHQFDVHSGACLTLLDDVPASAETLLAQHYIHVAAGARVQHVREAQCAANQVAVLQTHVQVAAGGDYQFYALTTGAQRLRQRVQVDLQGAGAQASVAAAYVLQQQAHHDFAVLMNHLAPACTSQQRVKGVVAQQARGAFQGKIHVAQVAQDTAAYQLHQALLLGTRAAVDAKPELEIYADRVKCSHGNAVGALDAQALFYLRARGLSAEAARALLMQAFLADTLDYAPEAMRDVLGARLQQLLSDLPAE